MYYPSKSKVHSSQLDNISVVVIAQEQRGEGKRSDKGSLFR